MKPYGPKAIAYEWKTDHKLKAKSFKSSERLKAKRDITNGDIRDSRKHPNKRS